MLMTPSARLLLAGTWRVVQGPTAACRAFYDADDLQAARRWLQKALHLAPAQPVLRFNIAAVMQVTTG